MEKMPQARRSGLIIQEVDSEILIYDQDTNKAHCLNQTAAKIWKYCDGETTLADACGALSRELEAPVDEKLVGMQLINSPKIICWRKRLNHRPSS